MKELKINKLSFAYGGKDKIFDEINLSLKSGFFYALTGPNGSGKSTFIKILSGIMKKVKGEDVFGQIQFNFKEDFFAASVFEDADAQILYEEVFKEIDFFAGNCDSFDRDNLERILKFFNIKDKLKINTYNLSSGEKQKYLIAMALSVGNDKIFLIDEPVSYLDKASVLGLADFIAELKQNDFIVLACGNFFGGLKELIDYRLRIENKKIVFCDKIEEKRNIYEKGKKDKLALSLRNLSFSIDDVKIFSDISMDFYSGCVNAIVGANGSGKTTLAKICCGFIKNYSGDIVSKAKETIYISSNPLNFLFLPTVQENVRNIVENEESAQRVFKKIEEFASPFKYISRLSKSQAHMIAIICAIEKNPDLLIIDEPMLSLDKENGEYVFEALLEYAACGGCPIVISHSDEILSGICLNTQNMAYAQ